MGQDVGQATELEDVLLGLSAHIFYNVHCYCRHADYSFFHLIYMHDGSIWQSLPQQRGSLKQKAPKRLGTPRLDCSSCPAGPRHSSPSRGHKPSRDPHSHQKAALSTDRSSQALQTGVRSLLRECVVACHRVALCANFFCHAIPCPKLVRRQLVPLSPLEPRTLAKPNLAEASI